MSLRRGLQVISSLICSDYCNGYQMQEQSILPPERPALCLAFVQG
jgi:hypothetical protein